MPTPPPNVFDLPGGTVHKHDGRSRVWDVTDEAGQTWVVKRFEYSPRKQRLVRWLGRHPAQREALWNQRLRDEALPVVPIVAQGVDELGRSWLVTPRQGVSLYQWLRHDPAAVDFSARRDISQQLATLIGALLRRRLLHGDCKASNLVFDAAGQLQMIDTGAVEGAKGIPLLTLALRMLTVLHRNLQTAASRRDSNGAAGITRAERLRYLRQLEATFPKPVDGFQHLPRSGEFGAGGLIAKTPRRKDAKENQKG